MSHARQKFLSVAAILLVTLACASLPVTATPVPGAINTSIAQTIVAELTRSAGLATPTATSTLTSELPTVTSTETLTPTQTLTATLAFTSTPLVPLISVSTPTNCRNGPGKVYVMEGALLVGEVAEVYGRDPTNNYWYIRNPNDATQFCWVWGKYATVTGPFAFLPVFTPPPTPTATLTPLPTSTSTPSPAFKAEYSGLEVCNGAWWADVQLKNKGSVPFKSVNVSVKDNVTNVTVVNLADGFTNLDGCLTKSTKDVLGPKDTYLLSAPAFNYDPTGHELLAILTLCSDTGQKGMCATAKITFTP
ncbi:MAG: hypothetical protein HY865_26885 [Chloroflexi bacterium]|nr:hypothetical protein [Chloroflexota bacterium]